MISIDRSPVRGPLQVLQQDGAGRHLVHVALQVAPAVEPPASLLDLAELLLLEVVGPTGHDPVGPVEPVSEEVGPVLVEVLEDDAAGPDRPLLPRSALPETGSEVVGACCW